MRTKLTYVTPVLGAAAVAAAIFAAPIASAATVSDDCADTGGGTVCQSPGNVQIDATPAPLSYNPYGDEAFLLGDGFGGFHGGGFGGFHGGGHR
ncbi:hypothetical protein [Mycobacterium sp. 3519A]|uniref:hypothetical protein n=1 Tax=Mycobacterium sp. 3519A TaxID=2057184 RepID=UPI000C7A32D3|nr:hypothetical protein [Mycobacterium sp. 3519A]